MIKTTYVHYNDYKFESDTYKYNYVHVLYIIIHVQYTVCMNRVVHSEMCCT